MKSLALLSLAATSFFGNGVEGGSRTTEYRKSVTSVNGNMVMYSGASFKSYKGWCNTTLTFRSGTRPTLHITTVRTNDDQKIQLSLENREHIFIRLTEVDKGGNNYASYNLAHKPTHDPTVSGPTFGTPVVKKDGDEVTITAKLNDDVQNVDARIRIVASPCDVGSTDDKIDTRISVYSFPFLQSTTNLNLCGRTWYMDQYDNPITKEAADSLKNYVRSGVTYKGQPTLKLQDAPMIEGAMIDPMVEKRGGKLVSNKAGNKAKVTGIDDSLLFEDFTSEFWLKGYTFCSTEGNVLPIKFNPRQL